MFEIHVDSWVASRPTSTVQLISNDMSSVSGASVSEVFSTDSCVDVVSATEEPCLSRLLTSNEAIALSAKFDVDAEIGDVADKDTPGVASRN
jgi:hypothetical protein